MLEHKYVEFVNEWKKGLEAEVIEHAKSMIDGELDLAKDAEDMEKVEELNDDLIDVEDDVAVAIDTIEYNFGNDADMDGLELVRKYRKAEEDCDDANEKIKKVEKMLNTLQGLFGDDLDIDTSSKSISTYVRLPKDKTILEKLSQMGMDTSYYDELDEEDFKDEVDEITVRISDHGIGHRWVDDFGDVDYDSDCALWMVK